MRRRRNMTALFTTAVLVVTIGLIYSLIRQNEWWLTRINKTSLAIENRTDDRIEIVSVSIDGKRRGATRLAAGEFTMLLGFFTAFSPDGHLEFELVYRVGEAGAARIYRHRASKEAVASECDFKFIIGEEGIDAARSCPVQPPYLSM
jgi:hypothetical protein